MRALITGVTGFAGSHLAEILLSRGDAVCGLSRTGQWHPNTPSHLSDDVPLFAWDISGDWTDEFYASVSAFEPDCIFHLAALSIPADCGKESPSPEAQLVNIQGTGSVVRLAHKLKPGMRFVMASSCLVYGSVDPQQPLVNEETPLNPQNGYAKAKVAAETIVHESTELGLIDGVVARSFQHAGPRQSPRLMLSEWAREFVKGDDPIRVISLATTLDLLDVRDAMAAYRLLATHDNQFSCYNVGSGVARTGSELFELLNQAVDRPRRVIESAPSLRVNPIADTSRLSACAKWRPSIPIERTVKDLLDYWQDVLASEA